MGSTAEGMKDEVKPDRPGPRGPQDSSPLYFWNSAHLSLFATLATQYTNNHLSDRLQVLKSDADKQTMIDKGKEMLANAQVKNSSQPG